MPAFIICGNSVECNALAPHGAPAQSQRNQHPKTKSTMEPATLPSGGRNGLPALPHLMKDDVQLHHQTRNHHVQIGPSPPIMFRMHRCSDAAVEPSPAGDTSRTMMAAGARHASDSANPTSSAANDTR